MNILILVFLLLLASPMALKAEPINFDLQIRPLLEQHCQACHGEKRQEGGLRLDSKKWSLKGGDSGSAFVANDLQHSEVYQRIISADEDLRMPAEAPALTAAQQELIKQWIMEGAHWTESEKDKLKDRDPRLDHWSFQPIKAPVPPQISSPLDAENPIDLFILEKSQQAKVATAPQADRRTLIRRAYFDMLGLSPTYVEVQQFVNDPHPDAYIQLVDRLLASPHYGERYGRHWLDIARYADTMGYNFVNDNRHYFAWTYRDYVIQSMNADLPYDVFIHEQIAADRMHKNSEDKSPLAALGFLTVGGNFVGDEHGRTDDQIDVVARGLMGLTLQCARCHAHKYDPLSMGDYYALYGVMKSSKEPVKFSELASTVTNLPVIAPAYGSSAEIKEYESRVQQELQKLDAWDIETIKEISTEIKSRARHYVAKVKNEAGDKPFLRDRIIKFYEREINDNAGFKQKSLSEFSEDEINLVTDRVIGSITPENLKQIMVDKEENERKRLAKVLGKLHGTHPGAPIRAMVVNENREPYDPVIFLRGNDNTPGDPVPRRFIDIFNETLKLKPFTKGSGRPELAQAITHPKNPLTARVLVNRLWQWHFGQGLVRTPGDFGLRGELPTHPELLDYLATYLIEHDWSIKAVQRLIITSATYQRSSVPNSIAISIDPENRLWSHQNVRRLELEPLRDSLLQHTVGLDESLGGQPLEIFDAPYPTKRTVYGFIDRLKIDPEFRTFDFASVDASCPQRPFTTVPQQTLFMLNHTMMANMANALAMKIETLPVDGASDKSATQQRITYLYRELFQREPSTQELTTLVQYLEQEQQEASSTGQGNSTLAWTKISQALLMSNEFSFVD